MLFDWPRTDHWQQNEQTISCAQFTADMSHRMPTISTRSHSLTGVVANCSSGSWRGVSAYGTPSRIVFNDACLRFAVLHTLKDGRVADKWSSQVRNINSYLADGNRSQPSTQSTAAIQQAASAARLSSTRRRRILASTKILVSLSAHVRDKAWSVARNISKLSSDAVVCWLADYIGTKLCRYNSHSAGSVCWPFPILKYKYIFQIKYTKAIVPNSTRKLLWFVISKMLIAVWKNKFILSFIIILAHFRFLATNSYSRDTLNQINA